MKRGERNKILFVTLMVVLFTPLFQQLTRVVNETPLRGAIKKAEEPLFSWDDWFNGSYQKAAEKYLNTKFGFRNAMVRVNNQLYYSLFNKAKANGVVIGKKKYLYEYSYIDAYYGTDFLGTDTIHRMFMKLKALQDTLDKQGKTLLLVLAPGKATFFPEYIPDRYKREKTRTNLEEYVKQSTLYGIHYLNFSKWFVAMKDTARYPLYPKTGIHWSYYGMSLAADSMVKTLEHLRKTDLPDIIVKKIEVSRTLRDPDRDIEKGMNLIFPLPNFPMPYPVLEVDTAGKTRPNALVIADSYYWQMFNEKLPHRLFNHHEFWFYNRQIFPKRKDGVQWANELDLTQELPKQDIIILLCTEPVLKRLFWGFVDDAYDVYFRPGEYRKRHPEWKRDKIKLEHIINSIRNDKKWYEKIVRKAKKRGIPVDSMLRTDAVYLLKKKAKKERE